jgi:2-phosphoglycerate kinase
LIDSKDLRKRVRKKLHEYGYGRLEKYYLASRQVAKLEKPVIILIGGASGVGKSAVSAEIGRRYGIDRFIGTDLIREIMRYLMPREINPILHESTFNADSGIINPSVEDEVIYSFYEQSRIVCKGVDAYIRRIIKEGIKTVINGVHLIPGLFRSAGENAGSIHFYHYVLYIGDEEEHKHRFHLRAEGTRRDPERYIGNMEKIRRIQDYYMEAAEKEGVRAVENSDFETTVETIFKDITQRLGEEIIGRKEEN